MDEEEVRREQFFAASDRAYDHHTRADEIIRDHVAYLESMGQLRGRYVSIPIPPSAIEELRLAAGAYHQALQLVTIENGIPYSNTHNQLGVIYRQLEILDRSFYHIAEAIRSAEALGERWYAGSARENMARLHFDKGHRYHDAWSEAQAALAHFRSCGPDAERDVRRVERLITEISGQLYR